MGVSRVADNDFARMLAEYAWSKRPPLTFGQLAQHAGVSRATIYAWVARGITPMPSTLYDVGRRLGIPLSKLYAAAGVPMPEAPQPRREFRPGDEAVEALWEQMLADVREALREQGMTASAIEQVMAHVRVRRHSQVAHPPTEAAFGAPVVTEYPPVEDAGGGSSAAQQARLPEPDPVARPAASGRGKRRGPPPTITP